jgi:CDP-4-dehydro-6-deoxyglucose reductase, E1
MADDPRQLRDEILELTRRYHDAAFGGEKPFEPGVTRLPYGGRVFDQEEVVALVDASLDFWLTYGRYSERFEKGLAAFLGLKHCALVNSGSSANLLAFMALTSERLGERRVMPGDEVITVAAGFPTTVAPIVQYGAVPVFVDVEIATANASVPAVEAAFSERTKAVMLAHTLGNPFDAASLRELCDGRGIWLVEDNCDSLGSRLGGGLTGTFGHIATSSFYPPHHITTGEGGAVYTDDDELASIAVSMRDWGRDCWCPSGKDNTCGRRFSQQFGTLPFGYDHKYVYSEFGYNLRATDMQAAVGVAQLEKLPGFIEARRRNWSFLSDALADLADVLALPQPTPASEPSWFGFLVTVRDGAPFTRDSFVAALERAMVQTRTLFAGNIVRQPVFDGMRARGEGYRIVGELPNTERIMNDAFWIGLYPGLSSDMLEYMADALIRVARP